MPSIRYLISNEKQLFIAKYIGLFSVTELMELTQMIWNDPEYDVHHDYILDITGANFKITSQDILNLVRFFNLEMKASKGKGTVVVIQPIFTAVISILSKKATDYTGNICYSNIEGACLAMNTPIAYFHELNNPETCKIIEL
jgi:hypothetical protein